MAVRLEIYGLGEDEIRHEFALVVLAHCTADDVVMQGSSTCQQVWCPQEADEVFACGTFQSIATLACLLVEQWCKTVW